MAVVLKTKFRLVHDPTVARPGGRTSVNNGTNVVSPPSCKLGSGLCDVLLRVLLLGPKYGNNTWNVICRVDVESAFRHVPVGLAVALAFGFVVGDHVVIALRLQFGWRKRSGFWGTVASVIDYPHTRSTFQNAFMSPQGATAVAHVVLAPPRRNPA